ncbi:MAG: AbrB family transcriptional regulator [Proteobacteria bacterium]|nr:AbrB family transcriptional regulator [Pseudomonadota bacterium]
MSAYEEAEDRQPESTQGWRRKLPRALATLAFAALGGFLFSLAKMPLAWMIGAMLFTAVAAIAGVKLEPPGRFRAVMITVLGVMLGSAFKPEILERAAGWGITILVLLAFVALITVVLAWGFERFGGLGRREAILSATPGGFGEMVLIAEAYGGDVRSISLIHATRVMFTVMVIPIYFRVFEGYVPPSTSPMGSIGGLSGIDGSVLTACAVVGYFGAKQLKIPAAALLGPMLISAAVHLAGLSEAKPPGEIVNLAQLVIGTNVGCRFVGVERRQLINPIGIGVIGAALTLAAAIGAAAILHSLTGLEYHALWIAFAPGGLAEMTLISLAMGIDTAFVSTHHIVRILFIVVSMSVVSRWLFGPPPKDMDYR